MTLIISPFLLVMVLVMIAVVILLEIGIMRRLDKTKESLQQIIMERKAILEEYLSDERFTGDYYAFGEKNSKTVLEEMMNKAVINGAGGGDSLSLLASMSNQLQEWMEGVLNSKMRLLTLIKEENQMLLDGLMMVRWWCDRKDADYTMSYQSMNKGMMDETDRGCEFEIEEFKKHVNFGQLAGCPIGLEFFKSFCFNQTRKENPVCE